MKRDILDQQRKVDPVGESQEFLSCFLVRPLYNARKWPFYKISIIIIRKLKMKQKIQNYKNCKIERCNEQNDFWRTWEKEKLVLFPRVRQRQQGGNPVNKYLHPGRQHVPAKLSLFVPHSS
jgi:hypothetical protein